MLFTSQVLEVKNWVLLTEVGRLVTVGMGRGGVVVVGQLMFQASALCQSKSVSTELIKPSLLNKIDIS